MPAHPFLRIECGILLLHIEVSHRLFSLRWLMPLSPRQTKTMYSRLRARTRLRNRTLHDESNPPLQGCDALARARSLNRDQSTEPVSVQKQSADTRQPLCRFLKREIHFSGKRIDDGTTWKRNCKFGTVVVFHVHPLVSQPLSGCSAFGCSLPNFLIFFLIRSLAPQCNVAAVFFCG